MQPVVASNGETARVVTGVASDDDHCSHMQDDSPARLDGTAVGPAGSTYPRWWCEPAGLRNVLRQIASSGVGESSSGSRPSNGRVK